MEAEDCKVAGCGADADSFGCGGNVCYAGVADAQCAGVPEGMRYANMTIGSACYAAPDGTMMRFRTCRA